jgi:hypothetical protein
MAIAIRTHGESEWLLNICIDSTYTKTNTHTSYCGKLGFAHANCKE